MEHLLSGVFRSVTTAIEHIKGQHAEAAAGCLQLHPLRLISFQDAEAAVTFQGSQLNVFVALDTLFS
jgi:hypothetical protein